MVDHENITATDDPLPLQGQIILVTRPRGQANGLLRLLLKAGAEVVQHPVIEICAPSDWTDVDDALRKITDFRWIVFVSVNGVKYFFGRCNELGVAIKGLSNLKFAAIGDQTAGELKSAGFDVDLVPGKSDSREMARCLTEYVATGPVLVVRANRGSYLIGRQLRESGIPFRQIAVYDSVDVVTADSEVLRQLGAGDYDWVTVTSSAIARGVVNLFGEKLVQTKLVSISPTTSHQLRQLEFPPAAEAKQYNMPGVVQAIIDHLESEL